MITKTYQALHYQSYEMYVELNGKRLLIPFRGGTLRPPINGTFQTGDPALQAVLAKDSSNGLTFKEIGAFDDEATLQEEVKETTEVTGVTTVQQAREYLVSHVEGVTLTSLPNGTAVKNCAAKNKFVFPDLK